MRIAVVFDTPYEGWTNADFKREVEAKAEEPEAEYEVAEALMAKGHEVYMIGVHHDITHLLSELASFQPDLVFNACEGFRDDSRYDYGLTAVLEMHGYRYTGSPPTALLVARNKSMSKKVLAYHGIRVPEFAVFHAGEEWVRPSELRFPLIVKPLLEDASLGIAQASVIEDDESLAERVRFIQEKFEQGAIVEELIEGRELLVGLVGNDELQVLPIVEMTFGKVPKGERRVATYKAKWDEEYRKKKGIKNVFARRLSEDVQRKIHETCTTAFHALWFQDYGRLDVRLTHDLEVYVIEANPNPFISFGHDMANAAEKAGMEYNDFIQRIVDEAGRRYGH